MSELQVRATEKPMHRAALGHARCHHAEFRATIGVNCVASTNGGPIVGYNAEVRIECAECGQPFRFVGLSSGLHPDEPRVSRDMTELRAPIEPAVIPELLNAQLPAGHA